MKKIIFFYCLIAIVFISSCKKGEDVIADITGEYSKLSQCDSTQQSGGTATVESLNKSTFLVKYSNVQYMCVLDNSNPYKFTIPRQAIVHGTYAEGNGTIDKRSGEIIFNYEHSSMYNTTIMNCTWQMTPN